MLTIRKDQMRALNSYMRQGFEDRMVSHLGARFPQQIKAMTTPETGDQNLRALIRRGVEGAAGYKIDAESDVARFIGLMVTLGPRFDSQKEMQWATAILKDQSIPPSGRIELVCQGLALRQSSADPGETAASGRS
jgi:hypothetical protein